jgi:hypothetical protein
VKLRLLAQGNLSDPLFEKDFPGIPLLPDPETTRRPVLTVQGVRYYYRSPIVNFDDDSVTYILTSNMER